MFNEIICMHLFMINWYSTLQAERFTTSISNRRKFISKAPHRHMLSGVLTHIICFQFKISETMKFVNILAKVSTGTHTEST